MNHSSGPPSFLNADQEALKELEKFDPKDKKTFTILRKFAIQLLVSPSLRQIVSKGKSNGLICLDIFSFSYNICFYFSTRSTKLYSS